MALESVKRLAEWSQFKQTLIVTWNKIYLKGRKTTLTQILTDLLIWSLRLTHTNSLLETLNK